MSGAGKEWGAFMRLSRRAAVGMLLTGASVLISGNFFATEALAARKRTPSKSSSFATLQRNDGEESESETRDNTSDLTVCLHFFVATRR